MEPLSTPLIKIMNETKAEMDDVKIKVCRDPTQEKSDMYELKMALFDNGEPEEFLLLVQNFNMTLDTSRTLSSNAKLQYLRNIICGQAVRHFDTLCGQFGNTTTENLNQVILVLGT